MPHQKEAISSKDQTKQYIRFAEAQDRLERCAEVVLALPAADEEVRKLLLKSLDILSQTSKINFKFSVLKTLSRFSCEETVSACMKILQNATCEDLLRQGAAKAIAVALRPDCSFAHSTLASKIVKKLY